MSGERGQYKKKGDVNRLTKKLIDVKKGGLYQIFQRQFIPGVLKKEKPNVLVCGETATPDPMESASLSIDWKGVVHKRKGGTEKRKNTKERVKRNLSRKFCRKENRRCSLGRKKHYWKGDTSGRGNRVTKGKSWGGSIVSEGE